MRSVLLLSAVVLLLGCTSARVTATLDGEPVCPDFELRGTHSKRKGALKHPVKVTVLDGKTTVSERVALGKRNASDPASVLVVQDENETYTVRFAQCGNEFAPQPLDAVVEKEARLRDDHTSYECGEGKLFKEIAVVVKKGKPATRRIPWQSPPEAACLTGDGAPAPVGTATP